MSQSRNDCVFEPVYEDTVQCLLFNSTLNCDVKAWTKFRQSITETIEEISEDYLWHKDSFKVFLPVTEYSIEDIPPHLCSSTCFGDNIEDEWFIVHIVLELTKKYNDLIVQIRDNDGDFLLIEGANYLPSWANPESTENRVFVYNNHIHLIPPQIAGLDDKITLQAAIKLIEKSSDVTQVSTDLEKSILHRIGDYPNKIKEHTHIAVAKLPVEIAVLLQLRPNLIAPIVDTYCYNILDAKSYKKLSCFNDWVTVPIKFTKCLYAMIVHSKEFRNICQAIENDKKKKLGIKLAYGYQMMMNIGSDHSSKGYQKFMGNLKKNGYFKNNLEGSQDFKKLLQNANEFYSTVQSQTAVNVVNEISKLLDSEDYLKRKQVLLSESMLDDNFVEDNDDWLTIHSEDLNDLLNSRYGRKTQIKKNDVLTSEVVATELKDFFTKQSDFEGIEIGANKDTSKSNIEFNPDEFVDCLENMLKLISNKGTEDAESIESEYSDNEIFEDGDLDRELKEKLHSAANDFNKNDILKNMIRSMKEEKASSGPSSNLISTIGHRKEDFLDSDDD